MPKSRATLTHSMSRRLQLASLTALAAALLILFLRRHTHHQPLPAASMSGEPRLMLWTWETPEDLRALSPSRAGVAFLAREVFLGKEVTLRPRLQPLLVAPNTWLMAVVRLEPRPDFASSDALIQQTSDAILAAAHEPNVRALQIDFDATASQRAFYARVLRRVRAQLPRDMPLSITALTSWCGHASWLRSLPFGALPIDEAVPMFFRMGGPAATRASAPKDIATITEPLCESSIGIATDETWPAITPAQRVYVFRSGPWTKEDIARINNFGYQHLVEARKR